MDIQEPIIYRKRLLDVYGVEMSELENMKFSKWCSNNQIAMNTYKADERKSITDNWLDKYRENNKTFTF